MSPQILKLLLAFEAVWIALLVVLLPCAMAARSAHERRRQAETERRAAIYKALAVYLGGNRDLDAARMFAASHRGDFEDAIHQFQSAVAGRCEDVGDLALRLGLVSRWCRVAVDGNLAERRNALSKLAALSHYRPVYALACDLAARAITDRDEEIRLGAARILLHSGDLQQVTRLFEHLLCDSRLIRAVVGPELRRYARELCPDAIRGLLQKANTEQLAGALDVIASWERGLPLEGLGHLSSHLDARVRLGLMRLLPLLPRGEKARTALLAGLSDPDPRVRAAAAAAAGHLNISRNPALAVPVISEEAMSLACLGGNA
jgi:HEAT repeat